MGGSKHPIPLFSLESVENGEADELQHYGILGMRWGRRRSDKQLATARKEREKSSDFDTASKARSKGKKKGLQSLSNDELQSIIRRKELEKKYRELNPGKIKRGERVLKRMVSTGKLANEVINVSRGPVGQLVGAPKMAKKAGKAVGKAAVRGVASGTKNSLRNLKF